VFFPGSGWIVFDPTPAAPPSEAGFLSRMNQYWDWIELNWNEWIISYDFAHQVVLAQNLQRGSHTWGSAFREEIERLRQNASRVLKKWQFRHQVLGFLVPAGLIGFLALLRFGVIGKLARKLRLSLQLRSKNPAAQPQVASILYGELVRLLGRYGFRRS